MSESLDYLLKVRPEAMGHYFAFLKDCGKHLDPKTRALISVITKVHAQTEKGFRQYLTRALREGCTPVEVLDALLMAFPTLGLTKILWAVDLLLAMNLPGFEAGALAPAASWHDLAAEAELNDGEVTRLERDGRAVFVYRAGTDVAVYDSLCPHQRTNMPELAIRGVNITCPKHAWEFDARSGACIARGDTPLKRWPSKIENGRVLAQW